MAIPIFNASSIPLSQTTGTLPNVQAGMANWFQSITFIQIVKTVVNFKVVETTTSIDFQGVIQPFTAQMLELKPEGQRNWIWKTLHAYPGTLLVPDDEGTIQGQNYRVMQKLNYQEYGYIEYHIVQDYQDP